MVWSSYGVYHLLMSICKFLLLLRLLNRGEKKTWKKVQGGIEDSGIWKRGRGKGMWSRGRYF